MSAPRSERLLELFARACDLTKDEQAAFVARECEGDADLGRELTGLLAEDAHGHPELDSPAVEHMRPSGPGAALPETLGPYRILRQIGAGGMGVVYEAEQDRPRRRVALKVVKPGLASADLVRRFEHEAQVLGWLDHPGIARIFEAGTADTGAGPQPYFAMELVEGVMLTEYATRHGLDVPAKLRLIERVCAAVHHAHQKGIVHRDLKPSNILVDASGQPRVLDFGVARVTDADLRSTTLETHTGELIGTLRYMSPEQVGGRPSEIDTRSDVYALGVISYELLAGRLPHAFERGHLHEAARAILEDEPDSLATIDRSLAGDVATIVSKALEKDRTRRYASAEELASDILRYLRHEPIVARPPSTLYQLRKFARRNRGLVSVIAAAFVVLLAASIVSTSLYVEAEAARGKAEDRLIALQQLNDFFERLLLSPMPQEFGASVRVVDVLDANLDEIERAFPERPLQRAWLLQAVGNSYGAIAQLERATDLLQRAHDLRAANEEHPSSELVRSKVFLALARLYGNRPDMARTLVDEGFALLPRLGDDPLLEARLLNASMRIRLQVGEVEAACADGARSLARLEELLPDSGFLAQFRADYADALQKNGRLEEAERNARLAVDEARAFGGERSGMTYLAQGRLASVVAARGKLEESVELRRTVLEGARELVGEQSAAYVADLANLATDLRQLRRQAEAEERMREAVRIARHIPADDGWVLHSALVNLGSLCLDNGKPDEAEELLTEALTLAHQERFDPQGVALAHAYLGRLLHQRRDLQGARMHYESAHAILVERAGRGSLVECQGLALLALEEHDTERAVTWFRRAFEAATAESDVLDFNACNVLGPLIANLALLGRHGEALELSSAHWSSCAGTYARETGLPAQFEAQFGWLLHLNNRTEEGLDHLAHGTDEMIEILGASHPTAREYDGYLESALR